MQVAPFDHHAADAVDCLPEIGKAGVEGGDAQADIIGFAEIGDEGQLFDESAVDAVAIGVTDGDMRAAAEGVTGCAEGETERGQEIVDQVDQVGGLEEGFSAQAPDAGLQERVQGGLQRQHGEDRRTGDQEVADAGGGGVIQVEGEGGALPEPAPDGREQALLQVAAYVEEGGGAGTTVEVLVGATDRQVDTPGIQLDRHGADGVAEIPKNEGASLMSMGGDGLGIVEVAALEDDMREGDEGGVLVEGVEEVLVANSDAIGGGDDDQLMPVTEEMDTTLQDIQVRGEVEGIRDESGTPRAGLQGGDDQLEEVDRGRVANDNLTWCGTDQESDLLANALGGSEPVEVPAADQAATPGLLDDLLHAGSSRFG